MSKKHYLSSLSNFSISEEHTLFFDVVSYTHIPYVDHQTANIQCNSDAMQLLKEQ